MLKSTARLILLGSIIVAIAIGDRLEQTIVVCSVCLAAILEPRDAT